MSDKAQAVLAIREHMTVFGYDTSEMTDEQLEEGVMQFAKGAANAGLTAKEASALLVRLARAGSFQDSRSS